MKRTLLGGGWLCSLLLGIHVPSISRGEPAQAESMEWVVMTSDSVVVGKVLKVVKAIGSDKQPCQLLTVSVSRTIKGDAGGRLTIVVPPWFYAGYAPQWLNDGIPLVFCLVKNDGKRVPVSKLEAPWVLRDDGNHVDTILLGKSKHHWTGCVPVFTREFTVLTEPKAILTFLQATAQAGGKAPASQSHAVVVPAHTAVHRALGPGGARLVVPVDGRLEAWGQKLCQSDLPFDREEGASILGHFRTTKNIALLKSLLTDAHTAEGTLHRTVPGKTELVLVYRKKVYYVRQAAFNALRTLGVRVRPPVLEELLEVGQPCPVLKEQPAVPCPRTSSTPSPPPPAS